MPLRLRNPRQTHVHIAALLSALLESLGNAHIHSHARWENAEVGGLDFLRHKEVTVGCVKEVPDKKDTKHPRSEATIRDRRRRGVETQGKSKQDEEIMHLLPNLVPNPVLEYGHRNTDEKTTQNDDETRDTGEMSIYEIEVSLLGPTC